MGELATIKTVETSVGEQARAQVDHEHDCTRCGGLLVIDHCFDVLGDTGEIDCNVFRCIQCGDLVDPVILRNRNHPPALSPKKHVKWSSIKLAAAGYR